MVAVVDAGNARKQGVYTQETVVGPRQIVPIHGAGVVGGTGEKEGVVGAGVFRVIGRQFRRIRKGLDVLLARNGQAFSVGVNRHAHGFFQSAGKLNQPVG
jgi:hypothetical protein